MRMAGCIRWWTSEIPCKFAGAIQRVFRRCLPRESRLEVHDEGRRDVIAGREHRRRVTSEVTYLNFLNGFVLIIEAVCNVESAVENGSGVSSKPVRAR